MVDTCKTCKHWTPSDWKDPYKYVAVTCASPRVQAMGDSSERNVDDTLLYGGMGVDFLYTGPNFGCIHHEAK
jgi:hypothetical protein